MKIRLATPSDAEELLEIYRPYVEDTAISFEYDVPSVEEFRLRIEKTLKKFPYLIVEDEKQILGYAYASSFKERRAYDWAVETTIYLKQGFTRCGYGKALYLALEEQLKKQNILNLNACIAYAQVNDEYLTDGSQRFHEHMGYHLVGKFNQCGYKFNKWYDMIWMEKIIGEHSNEPKEVIWFEKL
jgi:phosphinothricin acetyltransferase